MTATHEQHCTVPTVPVLYFSLELGSKNWKLAFTIGLGQKPRLRTIAAGNTDALLAEIKAAKKRFGLPENAAVVSCYEAGRDGFWLHRFLMARTGSSSAGSRPWSPIPCTGRTWKSSRPSTSHSSGVAGTTSRPRRCAAPIVKTGNNHGTTPPYGRELPPGRTQKWKHIRISFPCCSVFSVVKNLSAARPRCDLRGSIPPVLSPWSIPTGELTPWPPQHRSKPTAAMPRRAPGRKPRGERPAQGATPSHTA